MGRVGVKLHSQAQRSLGVLEQADGEEENEQNVDAHDADHDGPSGVLGDLDLLHERQVGVLLVVDLVERVERVERVVESGAYGVQLLERLVRQLGHVLLAARALLGHALLDVGAALAHVSTQLVRRVDLRHDERLRLTRLPNVARRFISVKFR